LRFLISVLKINSDLERIGDHADGLAHYVLEMPASIKPKAFELTQLSTMFDITISMLTDIGKALEEEDTKLARKVYKKDVELNKLNTNASEIIQKLILEDTTTIRPLLFLFSAIRKVERVGVHIKNIAEDTIFYIEAEVLKHKKKKGI